MPRQKQRVLVRERVRVVADRPRYVRHKAKQFAARWLKYFILTAAAAATAVLIWFLLGLIVRPPPLPVDGP